MSKRKEWSVTYPAAQVAAAAKTRKLHHESRLEHWTRERTTREKDLRENGIVIDEQPEPMHSNYAGGPRYDRLLEERHKEAARKVMEHVARVKEYAAWERMLAIAGERQETIALDVEDVEFFAL